MEDPYLYEDCPVLKNKLGIKNGDTLDRVEVDLSCAAIKRLILNPIKGDYDFNHLLAFHKAIFEDIYAWAGEPRTVNIEKQEAMLGYMSIEYTKPSNIKSEASSILLDMSNINWKNLSLDKQAKELSSNMACLWKVHPFREGNTRTTITFINQFAEDKGMPFDRILFEKNAAYVRSALVAASAVFKDGDFSKPEYLFNIVKDSLQKGKLLNA